MLDEMGHSKEGKAIRDAVRVVVSTKADLTPDLGGSGTTNSLTAAVVKEVTRILA